MKKKITTAMLLLTFTSFLIAGCSSKKTDSNTTTKQEKLVKEPYSERQFLMGTYVQVKIYNEGKEEVLKKAFDRIGVLDREITVNEKGSEVDEINDQAGIKPVKVSSDVYDLIKAAVNYTEDSNGGFDLAIGPITQLWHIGFDDARKPEQSEIDQELKKVDYKKVVLNDKDQTVYLEEKGMSLDLGAIAKGYITDEVVDVLKENGVTSAIVDLGGNVYVLGDNPRSDSGKWKIGIQDPNEARNTVVGTVEEKNKSLVTSGIYERYLKVGDNVFHHLFNAKTGYPFDNEIAGVTIVSDTSIAGDALSTAVFSKGVKEGMAYVDSLDGVDAIFITKDDSIYISKGLQGNFKLNKESPYKLKDIKELK
ncbi:FAD:protein FMN transferase [Vagococcus teuberi]|uniref:FAD:protein FMN transferase n=1 Tax=Vagococcus teuberi TaxID=519472 RepID=A0A1J0A377_9ENTE|nr:FAD:protein FMN transferase [Vagococcus teuberi]APB30388.1 thiamine biosynthesis protein ApbE [Vagococcus teuberi]